MWIFESGWAKRGRKRKQNGHPEGVRRRVSAELTVKIRQGRISVGVGSRAQEISSLGFPKECEMVTQEQKKARKTEYQVARLGSVVFEKSRNKKDLRVKRSVVEKSG